MRSAEGLMGSGEEALIGWMRPAIAQHGRQVAFRYGKLRSSLLCSRAVPSLDVRLDQRLPRPVMNWTQKQIEHYKSLMDRCRSLSIKEAAAVCFDDCQFFPPALPGAIPSAEAALGCQLPEDLRELYSEMNGVFANSGANLVLPLQSAVDENEELRTEEDFKSLYMPFDHMLIFGAAGNGDLFFLPILGDGTVSEEVFLWNHENDSRSWYANSVRDFFLRHATNISGA